jgi:L-threonylcarbamoyladenylate synthase
MEKNSKRITGQSNPPYKKLFTSLRGGNVVIMPADTVYGIFASAKSRKAVKKIFRIKGRSFDKPLQVFFASVKEARRYVLLDAKKSKLISDRLPGPYTVILKLKKIYVKTFRHLGIKDTIGVRVINNTLINRVIRLLGAPLAATSANYSGTQLL